MAGQYGLSFMPGAQETGSGAGSPARANPVQEAIKLLSLRLPSQVNRGLAPNALMQAPGGAGLEGPGGMSVDATIEWLRKQMQQSQATPPPQAAPLFQPPSPPPASMFGQANLSQPSRRASTGDRPSTGGRASAPPLTRSVPVTQPGGPRGNDFRAVPARPPVPHFTPGSQTGEGPLQPIEIPAPFRPPVQGLPAPTPPTVDAWDEPLVSNDFD